MAELRVLALMLRAIRVAGDLWRSEYGLWRRRIRTHAFPRAPRDAMPDVMLVEDTGRRQREIQIPHIPPPGDLGEKKGCSSSTDVPQIFNQRFLRRSMTRPHPEGRRGLRGVSR